MAGPKKFCEGSDSFYGYDPADVIRVGQEGRSGAKGTPGAVGKPLHPLPHNKL